MGFTANDGVPLTQAPTPLSKLADHAKVGTEKMLTKPGERYVALIDADRLDYSHCLDRGHSQLLLIEDAGRGLADIAAGRTYSADAAIAQLQQRRSTFAADKFNNKSCCAGYASRTLSAHATSRRLNASFAEWGTQCNSQ